MDRALRVTAVLGLILGILFLFMWGTSFCGCASAAHKYVRAQYPPECETSSLEETAKTAIILVECPGREPVTEKVRKR